MTRLPVWGRRSTSTSIRASMSCGERRAAQSCFGTTGSTSRRRGTMAAGASASARQEAARRRRVRRAHPKRHGCREVVDSGPEARCRRSGCRPADPSRASGVERGSTPAKGVAYGRSTSGAQLPRLSRGRRLGWGLLRWPGADGAEAPVAAGGGTGTPARRCRGGFAGARRAAAGPGRQPSSSSTRRRV